MRILKSLYFIPRTLYKNFKPEFKPMIENL